MYHDVGTVSQFRRVEKASLVLGYGLHPLEYKECKLWIWYRQIGEPTPTQIHPERLERITVFAEQQIESTENGGTQVNELEGIDRVLVKKRDAPWEILKQFINEALEWEQTQDQEDTKVFTINERLLEWNVATERPKRPLDSVFIKSEVKQDLVSDMEIFLKSKEFYAYHGIPYKRGYLMYGPPGCGKTSLVSGLAAKFSLNICLLQMGHKGVTDNVLHHLFMTAPSRSIILIEDIDNFFVERTPVNVNQAVTFSGFINAIDGVGSAEGKIIIITTNNATKLDPALLRPGRIDKRFKIDFADKNEIEEMFLKYFPGKVKKAGLFRDSVMGNTVSTAEIQQHLIKYHHSAELACKNRFELVDQAQSKAIKVEQSDKTQETMHSYISLW